MAAGRIDVNVSAARLANALAGESAAGSSVVSPAIAPAAAVPGMFAVSAASTSAVNADAAAGRAGVAAHLTMLAERDGEAVVAYEVVNEENRRLLIEQE